MDLYHRPDNEFVATFIGSPKMNILPVTLTRERAGSVRVAGPLGMSLSLADADAPLPDGVAKLGVRPEHIKVAPADAAHFVAEVGIVERLGVETYLTVGSIEQPVVVRVEGDVTFRPGDRVPLAAETAACHIFSPDGRILRSAKAA